MVRDLVNAILVDDLWNNGRAKPERVHRSLKRRRDIRVKVGLNEVTASEAKPWNEQEMSPDDASLYRAITARCNFLSIDRPDIMYASKEECLHRPHAVGLGLLHDFGLIIVVLGLQRRPRI